jgi:proteic killer suppression protein
MILKFKDKKVQKICNDPKLMLKHLNVQMAKKLQLCLAHLQVAESFEDLNLDPVRSLTDFHALKADKIGEYAMSLSGNFRLILTKYEENNKIVLILELKKDYH